MDILSTKELITKVAKSFNCYTQDAKELISVHLYNIFAEELAEKGKVRLHPLGTFKLKNNNTITYQPSTTILREIEKRKN